ncbi:28S ribosomal protein S29, mitochondrial-like [Mya arenaria]|uniref:28S ribosomal protein S29, mitochondrial-like n=1 Tax=Mya arenaria TaxID=6604 RepID=UPI0022E85399|nr:28S ribosomal protein S29, mitochondrial-like [Mya arenaria]
MKRTRCYFSLIKHCSGQPLCRSQPRLQELHLASCDQKLPLLHFLTARHVQGTCSRLAYSTSVEETLDPEAESELPPPPTRTVSVDPETSVNLNIRTQSNDPAKHTSDDEGLFYTVPKEEYEKYVQDGQWHTFHRQVKTFQECAIMVRRPALDLFRMVDSLNLSLPPARFLFYGPQGNGKTVTLAHVVHKYAKEGWLTIHFPNMLNLIRYHRVVQRSYVASFYNKSRYDLTEDSGRWLAFFLEQNRELLAKFQTTKDYQWSERESTSAGTPLTDVVFLGIDRIKFAADCIGVLLKEIKAQAAEKDIKVLVAVEGVNACWKDIHSILDEAKQPVNAKHVSLLHHIRTLFEPNWVGGVCVGTLCPSVDALDEPLEDTKVPYTPQYLLKKEGFEFMDPFIPIQVPEFSNREAFNMVDYLIERKWIQRPSAKTHEGKKELIMLSNRKPKDFMEVSALW